jgi:hypothetical protein
MPKRKKDEEIDARLDELEAFRKDTEERIRTCMGNIDKLEISLCAVKRQLTELQIQQTTTEAPAAETTERPRKKRKTAPKKTAPRKVTRKRKTDEPTVTECIRMTKQVITDWKNMIYGSSRAKGGQHYRTRSLLPLTSDKHFRDLLETEAAWLAATEGKQEDSGYWNLQLFCKGNHNEPENQWKPPFDEMFLSTNEEEEKEE